MIELASDSFGTPSPAQSRVLFDQISVGHSRYIVADRPVLLAGISLAVFLLRRRHAYLMTGWLWYLDPTTRTRLTTWQYSHGAWTAGRAHYNTALQINPDDTQALNNLAWMLATWPDALIRDGAKVVALAERAVVLTDNKEPRTIATLAAALAESARFPEAVKAAERAVELARDQGNSALADSIRGQVEVYHASPPFRDRRYSSIR